MKSLKRPPLICAIFFAFTLASTASADSKNCNPANFLKSIVPEPVEDIHLQLTPHELELTSLNRNVVKAVQDGDLYTYFVDTLDQVHFAKGDRLVYAPQDFFAIKAVDKDASYVVKESGFFHFDGEKKEFIFDSKNQWDLAPNEANEYMSAIQKANPELKLNHASNLDASRTQVIKCLDMMSSRNKGKNFIMDSIVSSNVVSLAGVVTNELAGNHLLSTDEGRRLVASDLIANNLSTLITGPIVKRAVLGNVSVVRDFATRTAVDYLTNVGIKKPLYNVMRKEKPEDKDKKSLGDRLVPYDTGFGVVRFFPKRALDRALVYQIPRLMIDSCLKGSPLSVIVGPRMIRIADRYTWGLIYLGGRKVYLNATDDKK